jgi:hypothetical protein
MYSRQDGAEGEFAVFLEGETGPKKKKNFPIFLRYFLDRKRLHISSGYNYTEEDV